MLKLILHHTYKLDGQAVDISRHQNHGFREDVDYSPDGHEPGSGALEFTSDTSRVHVLHKPVWNSLLALRIEAWVKLAAHGRRHTIAVGQNAFSFGIRPDGVLEGSFGPAPPPGYTGPPPPSLRVNSDNDSPDGVSRGVSVGEWTHVSYDHDGWNALRLYINGELVAGAYRVRHPVAGVGTAGVWLGHGLGGDDRTLLGELDEVKIWKWDPQYPARQFSARPTDEGQRDCLRAFQSHVSALLDDPEKKRQFESWMRCSASVVGDWIRDLRARGEAVIQEQEALSRQYMTLWTRGELSGPKMEAWMGAWFDWMRSTLGPPVLQGYLDRLQGCASQHPGLDLAELSGPLMGCDPQLAAYLELMGVVVHERDSKLGWTREWLDENAKPGQRSGPEQRSGPDDPGQWSSPCGC